MQLFAHAVLVTGLQVSLFVLVPLWALASWRVQHRADNWNLALIAGLASAALLGRVCNGSGIGVGLVLGIWLAGWIALGLVARRRKTAAPDVARLDWLLLAVLLLAWLVRTIHPLQTWALGQSDAYSHLGFLRDVLSQGRLSNAEYPPAYAWVLAFPTWLLHGQPYWVARFGGAFFGVGLVLCTYVLMFRLKGRAAGLAAATLVAGCPLFFLLQKTGVGCFANQLGLILIPAALWAYSAGRRGLLTVVLAALAVSVPMMLLHVLILLGLLILSERSGWRDRLLLLGVLVFAFVLASAVVLRLPADRGAVIVSMLTGQDGVVTGEGGRFVLLKALLSDFVSIKRAGFGSLLLNGAAGLLGAAFVAAFVHGVFRRATVWRVLGAWGCLTCLNVVFGILQFSNYQREGWSLLIAVACVGGLCFELIWIRLTGRPRKIVMIAALSLVSLGGLILPPSHRITAGASESDVVKFLLTLDSSVTVVKPVVSIYSSGQGAVIRTLHQRTITDVRNIRKANGHAIYLRQKVVDLPELSPVMRILQPDLTGANERARVKLEEANRDLEEQLSGFEISVTEVSPHLDVWRISVR